ncbi:cancer/testis antigen 55-like [Ochotona princeps]|uniref:cancer/testis antigen 55-like n=1 Tax=Ochotona princeps TaxID=9978 RepID=UPI00271514E7|nr:cancer/testis antigen 55-like [Ochotona princeps]
MDGTRPRTGRDTAPRPREGRTRFLLVSRVHVFYQGRLQLEVENVQPVTLVEGDAELTAPQGEVASASAYNVSINMSTPDFGADATGPVPEISGPSVTPVMEEAGPSQANEYSHMSQESGSSESYRRVSFGCVDALLGAANCVNHTCYFSLDLICRDFEPYAGDCVEVLFAVDPETQSRNAVSVRPRMHKQAHGVHITSVDGRTGVIDNSIFFTLDSLKLPQGYVPQVHDLVNVVVVESFQSCYVWRAIYITPVLMM